MPARPHRNRRALEPGGDLHLVGIVGKRRGGCEEGVRRRPEQDRRLQVLAALLGLLVIEREMMAPRETAAQLLVAHIHGAMEGEVLHARIGLPGEEHGGGDVGCRIARRVGEQRQVAQLGLDIRDRLGRRHRGRHVAAAGDGRKVVPLAAELARLDADDLGEPCARAVDVGHHRHLGAAHVVEQDRPAPALVRGVGHGGEFVLRVHLTVDFHQLAPRPQLLHVFAHAARPAPSRPDRRRVPSMRRRRKGATLLRGRRAQHGNHRAEVALGRSRTARPCSR
jgi:hypothetical protein